MDIGFRQIRNRGHHIQFVSPFFACSDQSSSDASRSAQPRLGCSQYAHLGTPSVQLGGASDGNLSARSCCASRHSRSNCDCAFRNLGDDAAARCSVAATGKDGGRDNTFIRWRVERVRSQHAFVQAPWPTRRSGMTANLNTGLTVVMKRKVHRGPHSPPLPKGVQIVVDDAPSMELGLWGLPRDVLA